MKDLLLASLLVLLLVYFSTSVVISETYSNSRSYHYVVSGWLDWILGLDISIPEMFIVGSTSSVNVSLYVLEKGLGERLHVTSLDLILSDVKISRYVGVFEDVGNNISLSVSLPVSSYSYSNIKPGSASGDRLQILLYGYVEFFNGSKRQMIFSQLIPVLIYVPQSNAIIYIDHKIQNDMIMFYITIKNFDPQPIYNVYVTMYLNNSLYKIFSQKFLGPEEEKIFTETLVLSPGLYMIYVSMYYTTSYGITRSFNTSLIVVIKSTPKIFIETNSSRIRYMDPLLIKGETVSGTYIRVALEYSLNGLDWRLISYVQPDINGTFQFTWRPTYIGLLYIRARSLETDFYKEAVSNIISLYVDKILPNIKIFSEKNDVELGDYTKIFITIDPPLQLPVTLLYREPGETLWRNYTSIVADSSGKSVVPTMFFSKTGVYIFKAVAKETSTTGSAESNEVSIKVYINRSISTTENISQNKTDLMKILLVIGVSSVIATIIYLIGSKQRASLIK